MSSLEQSVAWTALRTDAIDRFNGSAPRPEDEAQIIDIFELQPQLVIRAIDETATALAAGKITWPWSVLRTRLIRGSTALREASADVSTERTKRIAAAERWILQTGVLYDREAHVEAELFGDEFGNGMLTDYAEEAPLRRRLRELWNANRHRGEQAERDEIAWAETCRASRAAIAKKRQEIAAQTPTETAAA